MMKLTGISVPSLMFFFLVAHFETLYKEKMCNLKFKNPTIKDYLYVKEIWEDEKTMNDVGEIVPILKIDYIKWYNKTIKF